MLPMCIICYRMCYLVVLIESSTFRLELLWLDSASTMGLQHHYCDDIAGGSIILWS